MFSTHTVKAVMPDWAQVVVEGSVDGGRVWVCAPCVCVSVTPSLSLFREHEFGVYFPVCVPSNFMIHFSLHVHWWFTRVSSRGRNSLWVNLRDTESFKPCHETYLLLVSLRSFVSWHRLEESVTLFISTTRCSSLNILYSVTNCWWCCNYNMD